MLVEFPTFLFKLFSLLLGKRSMCSVALSNKVVNTKFLLLQLPESSLLKLDGICRKADTVLVAARSYGLTGLVRVSVKVV